MPGVDDDVGDDLNQQEEAAQPARNALFANPAHHLPPARLPLGLLLPLGAPVPIVNFEPIGHSVGLPGAGVRVERAWGERGRDKKKRRKKHCVYCSQSTDAERRMNAGDCKGAWRRRACPLGPDSGEQGED